MHIVFVHTPVPHRRVEGRRRYWQTFDKRYYALHPNARLMKRFLFELPHWITWLGGVLAHEGFSSMEALDFYTDHAVLDGIDEAGIARAIAAHPADVYLFSPMTLNLPYALQIADMVKELHPRAQVIFGGIVATPLCEEVARHPSVDYVVVDRGEYALPKLLRALMSGEDVGAIGNLVYKTADSSVIAGGQRYPSMPVDQIPFPKIDLFPAATGDDLRYIRQVHALGCPFECSFCSIQTIGRKPSYFPISRVIAEIRTYQRHFGAHHHVDFGDETFTLHTERTLSFCAALEAEGDIHYDCQTRLSNLRDPRLPQALYRSGCRWVEVGIETAHQKSLDLTNKRSKASITEEALRRLRDAGIGACSFLIVGLPNETVDDMKRTLAWVCSLIERGLLHASYLSVLVPYPGTPIFDRPELFGILLAPS